MIDSHCHLADKAFADDLDAVIARANAAGIAAMICIADSFEESERCAGIAEKYPNVYATAGVHPHTAAQWNDESGEMIENLVRSSPKVVAIGEMGLDYHYMHSSKEVQQNVFRFQLQLAKELGKPAIVHCRDAIEDVWSIVSDVKPPALVLHCCTEKWEDVTRFVDRGYFLSFTGIATYPKSDLVRETIQRCPLGQLMVETDAPYLIPESFRAKRGRPARNEPAFVKEVAKCVAEVKGLSFAEVDAATAENAVEFFRLRL